MKSVRTLLRKAVALALDGLEMNQRRTGLLFRIADQAPDSLYVVPVRRTM